MECLSYCISDVIDLNRLDNYYKRLTTEYISVKSRDHVKLAPKTMQNLVLFIFKNGTVISWGIKRYQMHAYLEVIQQFATKPLPFSVHDEFSYQISDKTSIEPHDFFDIDRITIEDDSEELKLSLSYGFSQSVKLQYFETTLESLIEKYTPLIYNLTNKAHPISRNQIRRIIGEILHAKSEMNLLSNFLYHPKYFWQHPMHEQHYSMLERYMHIQRRINAINHRLDTLNEIFDMINDYLENRHAHRLEIIIIVLIVFEIIFGVLNFHF